MLALHSTEIEKKTANIHTYRWARHENKEYCSRISTVYCFNIIVLMSVDSVFLTWLWIYFGVILV